jgi:acetyl-CoA carboxylase biotin carboxyl carrier protein
MSTLTYRDVVEVLNLLKESPHCASLDVEIGDLKFSMRRAGVEQPAQAAQPASAPPLAAPAASFAATPAPAKTAAPSAEGSFIRAPLLGTFYRTPEPTAPPCVKVGDIVGPKDTVGLIEVMKLYTPVEAGVSGRIVEILAESGTLVEYDQPLFRIEPV